MATKIASNGHGLLTSRDGDELENEENHDTFCRGPENGYMVDEFSEISLSDEATQKLCYACVCSDELRDGFSIDILQCDSSGPEDDHFNCSDSSDENLLRRCPNTARNEHVEPSAAIEGDISSNRFDSGICLQDMTLEDSTCQTPSLSEDTSFSDEALHYPFRYCDEHHELPSRAESHEGSVDTQPDELPTKNPISDISSLADTVKKNADFLAQIASKRGICPSLEANGESLSISPHDREASKVKSDLLFALKKLNSLVKGPLGILMDIGAHEILCLQAISRFNIAQAMGQDEEVEFEELSRRCGLNVKDLQRILRYAMTNFIFCEPRPGVVRHTSVSQMLARDDCFRDFIANVCEVRFPASAYAVDALEMYGLSEKPCQSGFSLSRGTDRGLYDELAHHPAEARRWNGAMSALVQQLDLDWIFKSFLHSTTHVQYPLIVDVGGGRGDVSLALAERWPEAAFVVQDASNTAISQGEKDTAHLRERIKFQKYDFRDEQPFRNADVYYFKNIFHNWPDASCIDILRNQIPALRPGATILIDDFTLHEPATLSWTEERRRRWMDINMLVFFGSRERSVQDWHELLAAADPRFHFAGIDSALSQHNSILRVEWKS